MAAPKQAAAGSGRPAKDGSSTALRKSDLRLDLVNRPAGAAAVAGGGAVDGAGGVMGQRAGGVAAVRAVEGVDRLELAGGRDAEQGAVAGLGGGAATRLGGAVEIAVGVDHQRAVGAVPVRLSGALVDDREGA